MNKAEPQLKVAVLQLNSIDDTATNLNQILALTEKIKTADLVCLPENSLFFRTAEGQVVPGIAMDDPAILALRDLAMKRNFCLHLGSIPLKKSGGLSNSSILITPQGEVKDSYQKMHLFDISLEGQKPIRESDIFAAGAGPRVFAVHGWNIGQTICYDLRFSYLFDYYAQKSVDIILVPSAFLATTGKAHWDLLLRARAIESQCYIIAAAQAGVHKGLQGGVRETWGHSMVVGPWGEVVAEASLSTPQVLEVELSLDAVAKVRRQIPMKNHRKKIP